MPKDRQRDIYDPIFVTKLFNRMSSSYGLTNYISSFGFTEKWRSQCIKKLDTSLKDRLILDMMSGMGELWHSIKEVPSKTTGIDISPSMNAKAITNSERYDFAVEVIQENILDNSLDHNSYDIIISSFGLKTFNPEQLRILAKEVNRVLKPNGRFSFVEISTPNNILKLPYLLYLKIIIPIIGWFFMGNDNSYRYLGEYCSQFKNCKSFKYFLENEGLEVEYNSFFFGCATGVSGRKPS